MARSKRRPGEALAYNIPSGMSATSLSVAGAAGSRWITGKIPLFYCG